MKKEKIDDEIVQDKTYWEVFNDVIQNILSADVTLKLDYDTYYVYRIFKENNNSQQYIFGSYDKFKKKDIGNFCKKYKLTFFEGDKNIEILNEIDNCYFESQGLLEVDKKINELNSIDDGLNKYFNVVNKNYIKYTNNDFVNMKKEMYMIIQKDIMKIRFKDNLEYDKNKGYLFLLTTKDSDFIQTKKKLLFYGFGESIKDRLECLYEMLYDLNVLSFLGTIKYDDIKIQIIEDEISQHKLEHVYMKTMHKMGLLEKNKGDENKITDQEKTKKSVPGWIKYKYYKKY